MQRVNTPVRRSAAAQPRLVVVREALLAVCEGQWEQARGALTRQPELTRRDPVLLNLLGVVCQASGQWTQARRYYGKAMRSDRGYLPAEQNMRRFYELDTFGRTRLPVALVDQTTLTRVRNLSAGAATCSPRQLDHLEALKGDSPFIGAAGTMPGMKRRRALDWRGFAWAIGTVGVATAIGWPLVHSALQLPNVNALMLYLLSVIWVATHYSRAAAVLASVLGVAMFDFVFVQPYYTFAVADEQYIVTFAVMLLTALVISTLTDRMRQQSELARQAWERVETEFLRNTLLSGVSHELRTPLAAITGACSTLLQTDAGVHAATRGDLLRSISLESERMERLITKLLDMTRLESGGLVLKKEWQPLQEVVGSVLNGLDRRLRGREVSIDLPADLPLVMIDGVAMEQVLTNLVENAVEYTPMQSPIQISARVETRDAVGARAGELAVEVADRGPGLPPGTEQRVFEKFFRIRPADSRHGIGLGLAIARGIVEAHGGRASAANRPGGGALFRFSLPLDETPPEIDTTA